MHAKQPMLLLLVPIMMSAIFYTNCSVIRSLSLEYSLNCWLKLYAWAAQTHESYLFLLCLTAVTLMT